MTDDRLMHDLFAALPMHTNEYLDAATMEEIVALMMSDIDQLPRNVIDACAVRQAEFLPICEQMLDDSRLWSEEDIPDGAWWMKFHAVMILGLIPGAKAGDLLMRYLRRLAVHEDDELADVLAANWCALIVNKPTAVGASALAIAEDPACDWYQRVTAYEITIACAMRDGEAALDAAVDRVAEAAKAMGDDPEVDEWRIILGLLLLDFPRERHKTLLETISQEDRFEEFNLQDIEEALARATDTPEWDNFRDPWQFYEPGEIFARQQELDELEDDFDEEFDNVLLDFPQRPLSHLPYAGPYKRQAPKPGRNDPCHCGSGKKYKKCHLELDNGA